MQPKLEAERPPRVVPWPKVAFLTALAAAFMYMALTSLDYPALARYMPLGVGSAGFVLTMAILIPALMGRDSAIVSMEAQAQSGTQSDFRRTVVAWAWLLGLVLCIAIVGLRIGIAVWVSAILIVEARIGPTRSVAIGAGFGGGLWLFGSIMGLFWPASLIGL